MAKKKSSNKPSLKRDPAVRERIVAVALEHPDFGTRRLSPLLKTEGIVVSESGIRSILLKKSLHTCKLRQQLIRSNAFNSQSAPSPSPPPQSGGEGIGGASPQADPEKVAFPAAPEQVAKSEPEPSIAVSSHAEPEKVALPAATEEAAKPEPEPAIPVLPPAQVVVDGTTKIPGPPPGARPRRWSGWKAEKEQWIFRAFNAALICMAIYAGSAIPLKIWDIFHLELDSSMASVVPSAPDIRHRPVSDTRANPMETYRVIWERNLFKVSEPPRNSRPIENRDLEEIAAAEKDVGLKLIGTVLANDPKLNHAVIAVSATRRQAVYREREYIGRVLIRGISRNNVFIETEEGEIKRLTVEDADLRNLGAPQTLAKVPPKSAAPSAIAQENEGGLINVEIPGAEVRTSLSNIQLAMAASSLSPHAPEGKSDGLYVVSPGPQNILPRLGLLPGDLIMGIDGVHLTGLEDTEELFAKFLEGGDFSILVQRGDQVQNLHLVVN